MNNNPTHRQEDSSVPQNLKNFANKLDYQQLVPINTGLTPEGIESPYISFILHEDDESIGAIGKNPIITLIPGLIKVVFGDLLSLPVIYILLRFNDDPSLTYETAFNIAAQEISEDCSTLGSQSSLQIITCGDSIETVTTVGIEDFSRHLDATSQLVRANYDLSYSMNTFMQGIRVIQGSFQSPSELWDAFEEHGPFISLKLKI